MSLVTRIGGLPDSRFVVLLPSEVRGLAFKHPRTIVIVRAGCCERLPLRGASHRGTSSEGGVGFLALFFAFLSVERQPNQLQGVFL